MNNLFFEFSQARQSCFYILSILRPDFLYSLQEKAGSLKLIRLAGKVTHHDDKFAQQL